MPEGPVVAFQGRRSGRSAFALVNARWSQALHAAGYQIIDYGDSSLEPDFVIHHDFESRFTDFRPPARGKCIAVRTWDFGPLPPAWVTRINRDFHQYWAHTNWIGELARTAGVDPDRIRIIPHGIDPEVYRPDGPSMTLETRKTFRYLFVGGVSLRKGSDLLLEAYARAFGQRDDVVLVLKDHSGDLFYRDNRLRDRISALRENPDAPEILHLDGFLPEAELAALYRSCDAAVFPYRAEGFCLPILEAMACGLPVLVPDFGACRDFCNDNTSYLMPVRRIRAPVNRSFTVALGFEERLEEVDFCEVPVDTLVEFLRLVRSRAAAERKTRGQAGAAVAREMTWERVGGLVRSELERLGDDRLRVNGPASGDRPPP